jgi:stage V sporulation protein G
MINNKIEARVYPLADPKGNTKAFASVAVDDLIVIRGIRVVEGKNGLFVTMPQSQDKEKNYHDIAFSVSADLRKAINKSVLDLYESDVISAPFMDTASVNGG